MIAITLMEEAGTAVMLYMNTWEVSGSNLG
jgi:hypothetical protein